MELNKYKNINEALIDYANSIKDNFNSEINIVTYENNYVIENNSKSQTAIFNEAKKKFSEIGKAVFKNGNHYIYVSNGDIKESVAKILKSLEQKKLIIEHLEIFANLDKIMENGSLIAIAEEMKGRYKYSRWYYYATPIILNNKNCIVEFDTVLRNDGQIHFRLERVYYLEEIIKKQTIPTEAFNYHNDNQSVSRILE